MKIPDAYFNGGFGQRVTPPAPVFADDARGAQEIGAAGMRVAATITDIAADGIAEQGRIELAAAQEREQAAERLKQEAERIRREDEAELKRLERIERHSTAQGALFANQNALANVAETIAADKTLTPQQKKERFSEQADLTRATFMESVDPEYQMSFAPSFDQHRYQAERGLSKAIAGEIQTGIKAQLTNTLEELARAPRPLHEKLLLVNELDWESAGFDAVQQAQAVQKFREGITTDAVTARLNRENPRVVLKDLTGQKQDGSFANYGYLEPNTRESLIHTAKSRVEQQDRETAAEAARRKAARNDAARDAYDFYKDARQGLLALDPKTEAGLWRAAQGTPYAERMREVRKSTGGLDFLTRKISEDPLKFGAAQMGLTITPFDFSQPDTWHAQTQARVEVGRKIQARHGLSYIPVFVNDETKGLGGYLEGQSAAGAIKTLEGMTRYMGRKESRHIAQQFAAHNPELGTVAGLVSSGKSDAARLVAHGGRLIKDKAVALDSGVKKDIQSRFDSNLGEAMTGMPQARGAFLDAVTSAYVAKAAEKGALDNSLDKSVFEEVFKAVVGGTTKLNGKRVMLPTGMPETTFKDYFKRIDGEQVKSAGGIYGFADPAAAAKALRADARLIEAGDGRYRFTIDGQPLRKSDNSGDFILEIGVHNGGY